MQSSVLKMATVSMATKTRAFARLAPRLHINALSTRSAFSSGAWIRSPVHAGWTAGARGCFSGGSGKVSITIVEPSGAEIKINAKIGESILDVARENDVELEGACEGTLSCSTCHCIFEQALFDTLPPPEDEELDMLDLAAAPTDTSRLGCQVKVTPAFEGARIVIPDECVNLQGEIIDESK